MAGSEHDKSHPIFGKVRKDTGLTLMETLSYSEPFKLKGTYLFLTGGYTEVDSNITFYDSEGVFVITGAGVAF